MRDFNRNDRSSRGGGAGRRYSGGGSFRGRDSRRRDSGPREMHRAVCDECGKDCEVPFRPSGDKPIFCSDCFEKRDGGGSRRPSRRDSRGSGAPKDNTNKQMLEQLSSLNSKLDRVLAVIEAKVEKKPVSVKTETKKVGKRPASKAKKVETKKVSKKKVSKSASKK